MLEQAEKTENYLDRLAYYDGRIDTLVYVKELFDRIMAAGGTPPAPTDPPHQILVFQVKIATECGRAMQDVSVEMARVKDDRQQFVKDKAVDLDGEAVH